MRALRFFLALGGLLSYNTFQPFVEDASDRLAMAAQLSTFFLFLSALAIQVDVIYHKRGFGALLIGDTTRGSRCGSELERKIKAAPKKIRIKFYDGGGRGWGRHARQRKHA